MVYVYIVLKSWWQIPIDYIWSYVASSLGPLSQLSMTVTRKKQPAS